MAVVCAESNGKYYIFVGHAHRPCLLALCSIILCALCSCANLASFVKVKIVNDIHCRVYMSNCQLSCITRALAIEHIPHTHLAACKYDVSAMDILYC